jgi:hypothetical protein
VDEKGIVLLNTAADMDREYYHALCLTDKPCSGQARDFLASRVRFVFPRDES